VERDRGDPLARSRGAYDAGVSAALAAFLRDSGIRDDRVLRAIAEIPRRLFVPERYQDDAEADRPLPIGCGQTISQPFVVAYMTEMLRVGAGDRVLEVGTGSGYQTAILAMLAREVLSVEIVPALAERAKDVLLGTLGLRNVQLRHGDGAEGWPEEAPFQRIIVTAAAPKVPPALVAQLAPGGRMILPVGPELDVQMLRVLDKGNDGESVEGDLLPVRFVPLTHGAR
jgi:protein-L-isoaspartate(D-aspartate) O-methyltransferase